MNSMGKIMTEISQTQHFSDALGLRACATHYTQTLLIRKIQQHFGEEPCYATDKRNECSEICEWRRNCRPYKSDVAQWFA